MVRLREGVSCERVADSWLVLSDRDGVVHNLTGPAATVIDCVTTGQPVPPDCDDAVATLVDTGILTAPTGWSRRKVLAAGGAAAAIGMVTLTLPTAAMAASVSPFGTVTATPDSNEVTIDWTAAASTSYQVVYKPTIGAGDFVNFDGSVAAGPVAVTGLTNNTDYSFKVQIVGSDPLTESAVVTTTPSATPIANLGVTWTSVVPSVVNGPPEAGDWRSVAHGSPNITLYPQGVWVAVANNETNRVMYSTNDGLNWTAVGAPAVVAANKWTSVAYGLDANNNGVWVAVANEGTNQVMTSPDGIDWTPRTAAEANSWTSVAYGNGRFVAVAQGGTNRVMTSPDGLTWTQPVTAPEANYWRSVAYGNGVWVAVAFLGVSGTGPNRVMRSTDNGATWNNTGITGVAASDWDSVAYGNGVWVAVAFDGGNRVMTSPDGLNWTAVAAAEANFWTSVAYGNGIWVAVAYFGANQVMTSPDNGVTWTSVGLADGVAANQWRSVAYGNGKFVAVAGSGTNRVMYSPSPAP